MHLILFIKSVFELLKRKNIKEILLASWAISWPMTCIMLFEFSIALADVYIAGRINTDVQASYGFVMQWYFILTVVANALTMGTVAVISKLYTSKQKELFEKAVFSSLITVLLSGIVFSCVCVLTVPFLFRHLPIPQVVKQYGSSLILIYSIGLVFHYVLVNSNGVLRACKMVKKSLKTMALVCCLNISLNFYFVFHTSIGYKGIALSTVISVAVGCAINSFHIKKLINQSYTYSREKVKEIISIGWPMGILQIAWQVGCMMFFLLISYLPFRNVEIMAAFTNGLRVESAIFLPTFAFNMANAVIIGNLIGENKKEDAYYAGIATAMLGTTIVTIFTIIIAFNARFIVSFLSQDGVVQQETLRYLYICLLSEPFMALGVILSGALNGAGDTKRVLKYVALSVWLIRIPFAFLLGIYWALGATALWWAMNTSVVVQMVFMVKRYVKRKWLQNA